MRFNFYNSQIKKNKLKFYKDKQGHIVMPEYVTKELSSYLTPFYITIKKCKIIA
jgi:hypothetical protein